MFVGDDQNVACRYGLEDENSPHRFSYAQMLKKTTTIGRLELFKSYREQPDDEVTLDSVTDQLVIAGTPDSVAGQILEFQEETATSASSCTPAWTGSTLTWPSGPWSRSRPRSCRRSTRTPGQAADD